MKDGSRARFSIPHLGRRQQLLAAGIALVVVLAGAFGVGAVVRGGSDSGAEIFLEPASAEGPDPFTRPIWSAAPDFVLAKDVRRGPESSPSTEDGSQSTASVVRGDEPGLYGGTQNQSYCDPERLVEFLTENPAKAAAWADTLGIETAEISRYVAELTPVVLLADTRVTNHGFRDGNAIPRQSVLQSGTAVLVDELGVPRVRCACGNPLTEPKPAASGAQFRGEPWPEFSEAALEVVRPAESPIEEFELVDVETGTEFIRPAGSYGDEDDINDPNGTTQRGRIRVVIAGEGTGRVTSVPAGIDCGTDCSHAYDIGTTVALTARAEPGSSFTGWTGGCTNPEPDCSITIAQTDPLDLEATFTRDPGVTTSVGATTTTPPGRTTAPRDTVPPPPTAAPIPDPVEHQLTVITNGGGSVDVSGRSCASGCTFKHGTALVLTAQPAADHAFDVWGGACGGERASCELTMDQAKQVSATFVRKYTVTVSIVNFNGAWGHVVSSGGAINCYENDGTCSVTHRSGTEMTLTANAEQGQFVAWRSVDCRDGFDRDKCVFPLTGDTSVSAVFDSPGN